MAMNLENLSARIKMREIKHEFKYRANTVVSFSASYPTLEAYHSRYVQENINTYYRSRAFRFYRYTANELYPNAVNDYKNSKDKGYPFRTHQAVMEYTVTYNKHCHLSTYDDRYEFTGGAHGSTVRHSDTWNLKNGRKLSFFSFFKPDPEIRKRLINIFISQAQKNPQNFFENYKELIHKNFKPENFYLAENGFVFYFQQYDIAPYASGIVEFLVPYGVLGIDISCKA